MKLGHDLSGPTLDAWHTTPSIDLGARGIPSDPVRTAGDHKAAGLGVCDEGMVIDLSSINSASTDAEVDFLDESRDGQFAEWLEESFLRLKAGQDRPSRR